ncbi:F-type H+-transporting ATPase subunit a [Amaricoccus macauensis]|uniref:ATP synthase subunit a n=1 Tax=Amaricoccus macauensis TaxID=57001 RepID=A0A840SMD6_9RHOB|nr:F0F1 ATP synthase subunit A [Amaricoccus macauensis]MBB5221418.1 F-type H+-transporting ATPase subunit a [Amaricoccus macauensis]
MAEEAGGSGFNIHPMEQFKVTPLFGGDTVHWFTPTNATLWLLLTVAAASALMLMGSRSRALVPTRAQSMAEATYGFVHKMVTDITGKEGAKYFPYIMTLFLFVLCSNLLSLIPTSFAPTSHIAVTAVLALAVFISVTVIGFVKHGAHFLNLFWVASAPTVALRIVLAVIEVISYFVRPLSHSVRLAGNLMAGHAVLKVFAGFAGALGLVAVVPIFAIVAIYGLEVMVAVIQAYVFAILTCVYLNDALHPGH